VSFAEEQSMEFFDLSKARAISDFGFRRKGQELEEGKGKKARSSRGKRKVYLLTSFSP
jgi:hypothetical protein